MKGQLHLKKDRLKRTSINKINQFLEMPEELTTNKPKLTILGFDQLVIENYKSEGITCYLEFY